MDVIAALITDGEAAEAVEPSKGTLDHPAVAAQPVAALDAASRDAGEDAAAAAGLTAGAGVICLVGMQLVGSTPGATSRAPDRRDGVESGFEHQVVIVVGRAHQAG